MSPVESSPSVRPLSGNDDLSRNVYCVLGVPIDIVDFDTALRRLEVAVDGQAPFLLSTPNVNFLVNFHASPEFRDSLLLSDLCPADGLAIVWAARLLGVPIKERVAGSDLFDALQRKPRDDPIRVFLFGGEEGVAEAAAAQLESPGIICVGTLYPGFGSVEAMSGEDTLRQINASHAQFLVVSLGAVKGQSWLLSNHASLSVPLRSHLGAVINFAAGRVKRAPVLLRKWGAEWLWRIKEEPHLWKRYANDGLIFLHLLLTRVVPLIVDDLWLRLRGELNAPELAIAEEQKDDSITLRLTGVATAQNIDQLRHGFENAVRTGAKITLDLSELKSVDARVLGLLIMLRKQLKSRGLDLRLLGANRRVQKTLRWHGLDFLLASSSPHGS